jgi:NodT family efflux transporter outer membrane factor (OMF) lipoprotein
MKLSVPFLTVKRAKRVIAGAIACGALPALSGCFIPNLRPAETGLALPSGYNGAPNGVNGAQISGQNAAENSALLRVDQFYRDETLVRLVCQALATNRELKGLEEDIQIARAQILGRRGAFLPLVGLRAGAGWDRNSHFTPLGAAEKELEYRPGRHFPATPGDWLFGLNFLIPLDIWRELRNARDAAIERYFAAIERRNDFVTRLVADVAQNYYGLMALDQRLAILDRIIGLQQESLDTARKLVAGARETTLAVQRFEAEVRKNQSEKLIVRQDIVEVENRINRLLGRLPQPVERSSAGFFDTTINSLCLGVPAQLLQNRPDIRQAEHELTAAGLEVKIARARFFPRVDITGTVGTQAFNPRYLFNPESLVFNAAGELAAPLINKAAIRADYRTANAQQLQALYNYQRVIIDATIEVVNRISTVQNYTRSIDIKTQQLQSLEAAVKTATTLFYLPREKRPIDYLDVLTSQRDLLEARSRLIDTKRQQLSAIVNVYQALGGGTAILCPPPDGNLDPNAPQRLPDAQPLPEPRKDMDPPQPLPLPEAQPPAPPPAPPGKDKDKDKGKEAPGLPRLPDAVPAPGKEKDKP